MKKVFSLILAAVMLLSASGVAAVATDSVVAATVDGVPYATIQLALEAVNKGLGSTIQLQKEITEELVIDGTVIVDLNGYDVDQVTVNNGTVYALDSQTADFMSEDPDDYGTIKKYTGDVQAFYSPEDDGCGWLMFGDNGVNASFHYVELRITDMVLRPKSKDEDDYSPSLYYKCAFRGDEVVAENVESFGVALSVVDVPSGSNILTDCKCSVFDNFQTGENGNAESKTSTLLYGIMKETNGRLTNTANANRSIYGRAYLRLAGGALVFGDCHARTLKEQTEVASELWESLDLTQKSGIREMYRRFTNVMQSWELDLFSDVVADPHTWYEKFTSLPIANADMTTDELRQLCVDYFRLQLSFTWTPNQDVDYVIDNLNKPASLPMGTAYSGLCYAAGQNVLHGKGNIYKILNYYNTETGVLDIKAMGENALVIIGSNCSWGPTWAWNRVSNSTRMYTMDRYTPSYNALPVGPYTYDETQFDFDTREASVQIIAQNGEQTMYESYANTLPGDGLYSSPSWHIRMCSIAPVVVRNEDGSIDPEKSYMHTCEQAATGTVGKLDPIIQSNGVPLRQLGTVDTKVSFKRLLQLGYIPFTIPEFVGQDPVEEGKAWLGTSTTPVANGRSFTLEELYNRTIHGNYVISNVHLEVKDPEGNVLFSEDPYAYTRNNNYHLYVSEFLDTEKYAPYANGENTIHIYAQLTNGELLEAFYTVIQN